MELILIYFILSLATSLTSLVLWVYPELKEAIADEVDNTATQNPKFYLTAYLVIATILAPFILPAIIIPNGHERFVKGMRASIRKPD